MEITEHLKDLADYKEILIQRYADARAKVDNYNETPEYRAYWKGIANITQTTLNDLYILWTEKGSVGYYVFVLNMSYVDAVGAATVFAIDNPVRPNDDEIVNEE